MAKIKKDMSLYKNAIALTTLNSGLRTLINAIYDGTDEINIFGVGKKVKYFFNHTYSKDPETNGGNLGAGVSVLIYYQPSTQKEYDEYQVIDEAGFLSGRRRLAVRIETGRHPGYVDTFSFFTTNHPEKKKGITDNSYGNFTPIDLAR